MKMRVLILNPPSEQKFSRDGRCQSEENTWLDTFPPTTLASIAGAVREKHETKLLDCIGGNINFNECMRAAKEFSPDFTVVNTSTPTIANDMKVAKTLKEKTGSKIITYGEHVTARYKHMLKAHKFLDYLILGEPETPTMNILSGRPKCKGVAFKGWDGGIWQEPEMDKLPFPAYDLLPEYTFPLTGEKWTFVRSGRGCFANCLYCVMPLMSGRKVRYHSPEYMIRQFKWLIEMGIKVWMFWDEIATADRKRMEKICELMVKEGLNRKCKWFCTTRVDRFDYELAKKMREAGCRMVSFGVESGNQDVLDFNRKGITLEQTRKAVKAARDNRLKTIGHLILGLPGSDEKVLEQTARFARELKLNFAQFYVATPFPGSDFYTLAKKKKWFISKDWSKVEQGSVTISYPNLSNRKIEYWRRKAYRDFYMRPYAVYSLLSMMSAKQLLKLPLYFFRFRSWMKK